MGGVTGVMGVTAADHSLRGRHECHRCHGADHSVGRRHWCHGCHSSSRGRIGLDLAAVKTLMASKRPSNYRIDYLFYSSIGNLRRGKAFPKSAPAAQAAATEAQSPPGGGLKNWN